MSASCLLSNRVRFGTPVTMMLVFRNMKPGTIFRRGRNLYRVIYREGWFTYGVTPFPWRAES